MAAQNRRVFALRGAYPCSSMLERVFRLKENKTTAGREVVAGLTTFAAMAYILAVNPDILKNAGMPRDALVTATALSAAISTALMALLTNFPLALAPGMGINAFFAFSVCLGMGIPWQSALGLVFINGCLFLLLSVTGVRKKILAAIPYSMKVAISAGIGLFIAFIGLENGGLIVANPATLVAMGDISKPEVTLFAGGVLLTCILVARGVPGAIILSMAVVTATGLFVPDGKGGMVTSLPPAWVSWPASIEPTFLKLNFDFLFQDHLKALPIILTLLLVDMFDNIGTLIGVTRRAGLMDADGHVPRVGQALVADSAAAIISSLLGTSTVVSYIESAAGIQAGGRTGLTALTTAVCFVLALLLTPVILMIPGAAVAPALVVVGLVMFQDVVGLDLRDFELAAPAILTILMMPLSFSISTGIGLGLITLSVLSVGSGKAGNTTPITHALAAIFMLHFFEPLIARWLAG
ncbi:MAG TPA: NCS2 family permease [Terrimicrobiaceae bacterium]